MSKHLLGLWSRIGGRVPLGNNRRALLHGGPAGISSITQSRLLFHDSPPHPGAVGTYFQMPTSGVP